MSDSPKSCSSPLSQQHEHEYLQGLTFKSPITISSLFLGNPYPTYRTLLWKATSTIQIILQFLSPHPCYTTLSITPHLCTLLDISTGRPILRVSKLKLGSKYSSGVIAVGLVGVADCSTGACKSGEKCPHYLRDSGTKLQCYIICTQMIFLFLLWLPTSLLSPPLLIYCRHLCCFPSPQVWKESDLVTHPILGGVLLGNAQKRLEWSLGTYKEKRRHPVFFFP